LLLFLIGYKCVFVEELFEESNYSAEEIGARAVILRSEF